MNQKYSTIIFIIGLLVLIFPYIFLLFKQEDLKYRQIVILSIILLVAIFISVFAWFLREREKEKYNYNYALQTGKLVGGTVFTSYPENTPGLGWI